MAGFVYFGKVERLQQAMMRFSSSHCTVLWETVDGQTSLRIHFLFRLCQEVVKCSMTSLDIGRNTAAVRLRIFTKGGFPKREVFLG